MKKIILFISMIVFIFAGVVLALEAELKPQTQCPVMGGDIDKNIYFDFQGQRVYFCCESCKDEFRKDPEKYMKKIEEDNILLESVQKKCPVMGGDIDKKIYTDYKGRRVYFCCESCKISFSEDPEKYLNNIE